MHDFLADFYKQKHWIKNINESIGLKITFTIKFNSMSADGGMKGETGLYFGGQCQTQSGFETP